MKPTELTPLRLDPDLRRQAEAVLASNETLSSFLTEALQHQIQHRHAQNELLQRQLTSKVTSAHVGEYVSASAVLRKLATKLAIAKARR